MSKSQFHFTWVEHQDTLVSLVQTLYNDETFFDCTLYAGGHHFDVHRLILSSCSPFFSKILQEHKSDNPVITLDGVSDIELRALVEYIYTGETSIPPEFLTSFFETTKFLEITGLSHYDERMVGKMLKNRVLVKGVKAEGDVFICADEDEDEDDEDRRILKSLRNQKHEKKRKELSSVQIDVVNDVVDDDDSQDNEFSSEVVELEEVINHDTETYDKFHGVFMKTEKDYDSSMEAISISRNNNSMSNCDTDNSMEQDDDDYENSVLHGKFQSCLIKNEDVDTENDEEYDSTIIEQSLTTTGEQNEDDGATEENRLTDNAENFVYVKLDNNTLQRVRGNQIAKSNKQSTGEKILSEKYLKTVNPMKKSFLIKRPKIQSLIGKDSKANPDDKKIYICLKCGNKYSHRRTLLHHIHWICDQPATYSCTLCPYMGKRKFQLKSHMKHAHMLKMS